MIPTISNIKKSLEGLAREYQRASPERQERIDFIVREITFKYLTSSYMVQDFRNYYERLKTK